MKKSVAIICFLGALSGTLQAQGRRNSVSPEALVKEAKKSALDLYYLNSGVIQGSKPDVVTILQTENEEVSTFAVRIEDTNDEAQSWSAQFAVKVRRADASTKEVIEKTNELKESIAPAEPKKWKSLATKAAQKFYLKNLDVKESFAEVSPAKLISFSATTTTYQISISDSNDTLEWSIVYTIVMANYSPLIVSISEADFITEAN